MQKIVKILIVSFLTLLVVIFIIQFFHLSDVLFKGPKTVVGLITDSGIKSDNNRTNILFLGTGGAGHDGPNLSDTMILASVEKSGKDIAIVSIPRDLWVPDEKVKINALYAFGEEDNNQGLERTVKAVSILFDTPIHYAIRVDFDGFIQSIDLLRGLDVEVGNSFTDYRYPIQGRENDTCGLQLENKDGLVYYKDATGEAVLITEENNPFDCRYEAIKFQQGTVHMDGKTALKYVRSRHGDNGENSDFARSARQEKVISAIRSKVFSTETLLNPKRVVELAMTLGNSIDTNITGDEIPLFVKLAQKFKNAEIRRVVLDSGRPESMLKDGDPQDHFGQFVLTPKGGSWRDLSEYIQIGIFEKTEQPEKQEKAKKWIFF